MLEIYIMCDLMPTCSRCYSRADILAEFTMDGWATQLCRCNRTSCGFMFLEQEDDYFSEEYWQDESRID